ncbi:MAG: homoserine dehydrogenase [Oscillatoriales cyanobacterium RM2_1_1]|nr:homoserine dehydrogenase [Oscillatoriales cyanobacterium SM2_3_0]NJO46569.1 homoserine dehydrogenase [Oscillatoriales cyanobacterium RM2_1_1]
MVFKIGLLGLGTVGTGTVEILLDPQGRQPLLQELMLHRVGVRSLDKDRRVELPADLLTTDLNSIVTDPEIDLVVELMGGLEPARSLILQAIRAGKHVVTANKAVISRYSEEIFTAATEQGVYVMVEAAVAGGIPVIQPLKQCLGANRIHRVMGIVNGTTNYILTRMQREGADFAEVLADAQALGYAEADPTADVDGLDAADKIAILAALAFNGRIKLEEVYCEGIRKITATDITYADQLGFVIKLLAIAERDPQATADNDWLCVRVHPTLVAKTHPLATINQVYNAILIEGEPIGQVMFFGPGAGAGPTASAVVSDMLNIVGMLQAQGTGEAQAPVMHPLMSCTHQHYCQLSPLKELMTRFYARLITQDAPGVIGKLGTCFGDHQVSLESIVQIDSHGELAEIVVVTHQVREGNFHQALEEMQHLEVVEQIPGVLRVL